MVALGQLRKLPEEAASILYQQLIEGLLENRSDSVRMDFMGELPAELVNRPVPAAILSACPIPPLGHSFWTRGDVQFTPESASQAFGRLSSTGMEDLSLDPLQPLITITGLKMSGDGLDSLCRAIKGDKGRGRRKGAGSLETMDEPLLQKMRPLIQSHAVASISQAAAKVVNRAAGAGTVESKIKRLARRYNERFPELEDLPGSQARDEA